MSALDSLIKWCEEFNIPYGVWNSEYIKGVICFSFGGSEEIMRFNFDGEYQCIE